MSGRAIVRVGNAAARAYTIDTPASAVKLAAQGEYRLTTDRTARLEVAVTRGSATIDEPSPWTVRGAEMLSIAGPGARPLIQSFNSARWDAFDVWSYDRASGLASSSSSSQLPYELRPYATTFDNYGQWQYMEPYGNVWYPSVGADWRPYYDGSWGFTKFGWTWYGRDRWAWPTHHYGRWGFKGNSWYWIPDRIWGPGWVSWSAAAGFVGWAPLGWDYHPAIGLFPTPDHPAYWPNYGPGRAWTFVPREHFAPRHHVTPHAVGFDRIDGNARRALADAVVTPAGTDMAVPRGALNSPRVPGNVRRPVRPLPSNAAMTPGAPQLPPRSRELSSRPGDDPAFAPRYWDVAGTPTPRPANGRRAPDGDPVVGPADAPRDPRDPYAGYAPRRSGGGDGPRGGVRDPGVRPAPRDDGGQGQVPGAVPRNGARGGAPERGTSNGAPASPPGGAVERGGRSAPRAGVPSGRSGGPPSAGPPPSGPPPARGGARRP